MNRFFHPDTSATSQLLTDLLDALDTRGFAITVLTGRHGYLNTGAVLPARAWRGGIEVRRLRHTGCGRFSLPGRALDCASFMASAFLALLVPCPAGRRDPRQDRPAADLGPAWLAARLTGARWSTGARICSRRTPRPWACACGADPWAPPAGVAQRLAPRRRDERRALTAWRRASPPGVRARQRDDPQLGRWRRIRRSRRTTRCAPPGARRASWSATRATSAAPPVEPVVELIALLADEPGLAFLFIGAGSGYRPLRAALAAAGLENVVFRPYQDQALLPQSLTVPDVHLVTLRPEGGGPGRAEQAVRRLAAGRPVVFIGDPEGDVAQIVRGGPAWSHARGNAGAGRGLRALRRDPRASRAWAPPPGRPTRPAPGTRA